MDQIQCTICGRVAPYTGGIRDEWHPNVWAVYPDGTTEEISPVCPDHDLAFDSDTDTYTWVGTREEINRPEKR